MIVNRNKYTIRHCDYMLGYWEVHIPASYFHNTFETFQKAMTYVVRSIQGTKNLGTT